ncbi:hypothetical protein VULLAG_LOCUS7219 [Vulpes lagopus]
MEKERPAGRPLGRGSAGLPPALGRPGTWDVARVCARAPAHGVWWQEFASQNRPIPPLLSALPSSGTPTPTHPPGFLTPRGHSQGALVLGVCPPAVPPCRNVQRGWGSEGCGRGARPPPAHPLPTPAHQLPLSVLSPLSSGSPPRCGLTPPRR